MSRRVTLCLATAAVMALGIAVAHAEIGAVDDPYQEDPRRGASYYSGVVPGQGGQPPRAQRLENTRHNYVTWPGFEMTEGGSRIFVQTTRPVTYRREDAEGRVVLVFDDTRIHLRNNRNPLVTEHFNTPVATAYLRRDRRATRLVIEMKAGVDAEPRISQTSDGAYHFTFLEFPGGDYPIPEEVRQPRQPPAQDGTISVRAVD